MFTVDVTEDFLDYLEYGNLSVELYSHRRTTGFNNEHPITADEAGQNKSFPDRCVLHFNPCGIGLVQCTIGAVR